MINSNMFTTVSYITTTGGGVGFFAGSFILAKMMSKKDVKDGGCLLLPIATAVGGAVGFALGCTIAFLDAVLTNKPDATAQTQPH